MEYEDSMDALAHITRLEAQRNELMDALEEAIGCAAALAKQHNSTILNDRIHGAAFVLRKVRTIVRDGL